MTTNQKGAIAETAIALAAMKLGVGVFKPLSDGERCDLIFDLHPGLLRIQCKTGVREGNVVRVPFHSARRCRQGFTKRMYSSDDVDAIAAYSPDLERCYLLPLAQFAGHTYVQLRLERARNNQKRAINWAADFELEARLALTGP